MSVLERLYQHTTRVGECLVSTYPSHGRRRAQIQVAGRSQLAPRQMWKELNGPLGAGQVVRHTCDNPNCVNPEHLVVGTQQDNIQDMHVRGRYRHGEPLRGEDHPGAKLSWGDVSKIRLWYAQGFTQKELAKDFGVAPITIHRVVNYKLWKEP